MSDAVQIERARAVSLFEALGYKTATDWDAARLQNTLANIDEFVEEEEIGEHGGLEEDEEATLIEAKAAIEDGLEIEVVESTGNVAEGAEVDPDIGAEELEVPEEAEATEGAESEPELEKPKPKPKRGQKKGKGKPAKKKQPAKKDKKMSQPDAAVKILQEEGHPMNCKEMVVLMGERGYWSSPKGKTPEASLSARIGKEIQSQKSRFCKTKPGHFELTSESE